MEPRINERLASQLRSQLDENTALVATSIFGSVIRRDPVTTRVLDIAVFVAKNIVEQDGYIHSEPELVVEVLSPANTRPERAQKLRDYESLVVPEVWALSPEAETFEVLQLRDGRLITTALLREGTVAPVHFPQAVVNIPAVFSATKIVGRFADSAAFRQVVDRRQPRPGFDS
jgi:Uma2 family endonuclease